MRRAAIPLAWLAIAVVLAGCASEPTTARLVYGVGATLPGASQLWPSPPEVPRYAYAGVLTGEENFQVDGDKRGRSVTFFRWLAGLDERDPQPVVLQRPVSGVVDERGRI